MVIHPSAYFLIRCCLSLAFSYLERDVVFFLCCHAAAAIATAI